MEFMSTNKTETEYHCALCRTPHRSVEDKTIYIPHRFWNTKAKEKELPDRYYPNLERAFR